LDTLKGLEYEQIHAVDWRGKKNTVLGHRRGGRQEAAAKKRIGLIRK